MRFSIRKYVLLLANLIFYFSFGVRPAVIVLLVASGTYFMARLLEAAGKRKRFLFIVSIVLLVGLLGICKYSLFVLSSIMSDYARAQSVCRSIVVPVGLSFFTFQALGYLIDVYKGKISAEKDYVSLLCFLMFFPTITSGPILRTDEVLPYVGQKYKFDYDRTVDGLLKSGIGLFQKFVVADRLAVIVNNGYENYQNYNGLMIVIIAVAYTWQIYFDFAGYSNIVIGVAKILSFDIRENFSTPYFSQNIAEFWRRWHISLSSWLRDYIYIPLGGNRKGRIRKLINLMIVFLVSGIWHGANWTFVIWGGLHGIYQVVSDLTKTVRCKIEDAIRVKVVKQVMVIIKIAVTFMLVTIAWVFFRADSVKMAFDVLLSVTDKFSLTTLTDGSIYLLGLDKLDVRVLAITGAIALVIDVLEYFGHSVVSLVNKQCLALRWMVYICLVVSVIVFGVYGSSYDAMNFLYFAF